MVPDPLVIRIAQRVQRRRVSATRIVGVLLAAGQGSRFGADKLLAPLPSPSFGSPEPGIVGAKACAALAAVLPTPIAVIRPGDHRLAMVLQAHGADVIECPRAPEGMGASLACAVAAAPDAIGWVIALADMPWIRPDTIARVADAIAGGAIVAAPFYDGRRGHPVGFGRACHAELVGLSGDEGARAVLARHAGDLWQIPVDDPGILRDVDTPADLRG